MRRHSPRFVTLASTGVLLFGCADGHPLAPSATPAEARGATAIAAPSSAVAVAVSETRIDVRWTDNSSNETQFEILRSTTGESGPFSLRARTGADAVTYADGSLQERTQHCYQVRAVRQTGARTDYSPSSNTTCALTPSGSPPPVSGAVAVPSGSTSVTVSWTGVWRVGDSFRIDRSTDGGVVWQVAGTAPNLTFTDVQLPSERSVCYRVVVYDSTAAAPPSNTTCTTPLAAPTEAIVRQVEPGEFDLTWRDNSAFEEGYEVRILTTDCGNIDGNGQWGCWSYEQFLGVLPAGSTRFRLPAWANPGNHGPVSVFAMKDGGYSDPAVVSEVTSP